MTKSLSITLSKLESFDPCDLENRRKLFKGRKSLSVKSALALGVTISDILWVVGKLGRKDLCVKFALGCAKRVANFNSDPRVKIALDATQKWLDEQTPEAAGAARDASRAARAAAWAARDAARAAAWAAEAAAQAAGDASRAAAWAAEAAGAARDASRAAEAAAWAAGAAWDDEVEYQRDLLLIIFR